MRYIICFEFLGTDFFGSQKQPDKRTVQGEIEKALCTLIKDKINIKVGFEIEYLKEHLEELKELKEECDLLITHGGVGSIVDALKKDKIVIAAARLAEYGEHVNDHQLQIIKNFGEAGYIIPLDDFDSLDEAIKKAKKFKPNKYKSNTVNMINLVEELINK